MKLSIIIPTLNEERNICGLLSQLVHIQDDRILEIIVVDGGSVDKTCSLVKAYPIQLLKLNKSCRAYQMNMAANIAKGDVLYFIHADTMPPLSYVEDIYNAIQSGSHVGCYSFKLDSSDPRLRLLSYFTKFNILISRGGDQSLFVTRSFFDTMEGYDESYVIMEDFDFIRRARKLTKFRILKDSVIVSARKYQLNSYFTVQQANLAAFLMFYFGASPQKIKDMYKRKLSS